VARKGEQQLIPTRGIKQSSGRKEDVEEEEEDDEEDEVGSKFRRALATSSRDSPLARTIDESCSLIDRLSQEGGRELISELTCCKALRIPTTSDRQGIY